jgi:hypothetical protein
LFKPTEIRKLSDAFLEVVLKLSLSSNNSQHRFAASELFPNLHRVPKWIQKQSSATFGILVARLDCFHQAQETSLERYRAGKEGKII